MTVRGLDLGHDLLPEAVVPHPRALGGPRGFGGFLGARYPCTRAFRAAFMATLNLGAIHVQTRSTLLPNPCLLAPLNPEP